MCQWPGCTDVAAEVDHLDGTDYATQRYDPTKLRSLCTPHHRERTLAQSRPCRQG